jgi:hypothetical protein
MTVACAVVALESRKALVNNHIVPSIRDQGFDEVLVVANYRDRNVTHFVPDQRRNTLDALRRKQVALEESRADTLVYVVDDHYLADGFLDHLTDRLDEDWDILCPWRYTVREGRVIPLNMGQGGAPDRDRDYVAGHAGVYRRAVLEATPWTEVLEQALDGAGDQWPFYDVWGTHLLLDNGARLNYCNEGDGIAVVDIEHYLNPEAQPWR